MKDNTKNQCTATYQSDTTGATILIVAITPTGSKTLFSTRRKSIGSESFKNAYADAEVMADAINTLNRKGLIPSQLADQNVKILKALIKAVGVIKQWHGIVAFDTYYHQAPEMKLIREAIKELK